MRFFTFVIATIIIMAACVGVIVVGTVDESPLMMFGGFIALPFLGRRAIDTAAAKPDTEP